MRRRTLGAAVFAGAALLAGTMAQSAGSATTLRISASSSGALKYNKSSLRARHGRITIRMSNPSPLQHAVSIRGRGIRTRNGNIVGRGGTSRVTATLKKGTYTFFCPVGAHAAAGMKGTLRVT